MTTDHYIVGAAAVAFLASLIYAVKRRGSTASTVAAAVRSARSTFVAVEAVEPSAAELFVRLHDKLDLDSKMVAALRRVSKLAESMADEHEAKFTAALAPKPAVPQP